MIYLYFEIGILSHQRLLRKDFQNNFVANFADVARNNVSRKERKVLIISRKGRKVSQRLFYCLFLAKFAMLRKVLQYFLLIIIIIISWRTWRTWRDILFFSLAKNAKCAKIFFMYIFFVADVADVARNIFFLYRRVLCPPSIITAINDPLFEKWIFNSISFFRLNNIPFGYQTSNGAIGCTG